MVYTIKENSLHGGSVSSAIIKLRSLLLTLQDGKRKVTQRKVLKSVSIAINLIFVRVVMLNKMCLLFLPTLTLYLLLLSLSSL
jgi:hypothetical protein